MVESDEMWEDVLVSGGLQISILSPSTALRIDSAKDRRERL